MEPCQPSHHVPPERGVGRRRRWNHPEARSRRQGTGQTRTRPSIRMDRRGNTNVGVVMPLENMPGWVTAGGGGVLFYLAYKFFWPSVRDALAGQATQWRSENKYIAQLEEALSRALQERDKAFQEKNELYQRFAKMEAQMQVM